MDTAKRYTIAKRVTINGAIANTLLSLVKIVFGFLGGSAAVLADGFHSLSDLITDLLVLLTAKIGKQGPDRTHPYGHGRIETIGSTILGIVLIGIAFGIAYEAIFQVALHSTLLSKRLLLFVILLSIVTNEKLFRYTMKAANKINSNLLRANAWHKRSDSLSSIVVLIGLIGEMFGLHYFDTIAAIIVAVLIIKMGGKMVWDNVKELIDTGLDKETLAKIKKFVSQIPGVESTHQLRSRAIAGMYYLDIHIQVDPYLTVSESHYIADSVMASLIKKFRQLADVTVHIDIEFDEKHTKRQSPLPGRRALQQELVAVWGKLPHYGEIQYWRLHYINSKMVIELYFPLSVLDNISAISLCSKYKKEAGKFPFIAEIRCYFN